MKLLLITLSLLPVTTHAFSDVPEEHDFFNAISTIEERGIVKGYNDNTFKPDSTINRAEFTKIIIEASYVLETLREPNEQMPLDIEKQTAALSDVGSGAWFAPYIAHAVQEGVLSGYDDGTFKPSNPINFAEASKIITKALALDSYPNAPSDEWYQPFLYSILQANAKPQTNPEPWTEITRGEMADMMYRIIESSGNWKPIQNDLPFSVWYPVDMNVASDTTNNSLQLTSSHTKIYDDPCDFVGDHVSRLEEFVDADFTFMYRNKPLAETVRELDSEFFTKEFLNEDGTLDELEGFIDRVSIAGLSGYKVASMVEACGQYTYYLSVSPTQTLRIDRKYITELQYLPDDAREEFENVPNVLLPKKEEQLFNDILRTFTAPQEKTS